MADYLTTNWTEKIKTNPVANLVLNSNKQMLYSNLQGVLNHPREIKAGDGLFKDDEIDIDIYHAFTYNQDDFNKLKERKFSEKQAIAVARQKINQGQSQPFGIHFYTDVDEEGMVEVPDYWANTYVQDYINIDHPKLRPCYIQALSNSTLSIKPPSVFFSDV